MAAPHFPFALLAEPAHVRWRGGALDPLARRGLADYLAAAGHALGAVLGTTAAIALGERAGPAAAAAAEVAFGCALAAPSGRTAILTLDARAARAILDLMERREAGLMGIDDPTRAELAVLEYALLETAERLTAAAGAPPLAVREFPARAALRERLAAAGLEPVAVELALGARVAIALLWLDPAAAAAAARVLAERGRATPGAATGADPRLVLDLALHLPPVALSAADRAAARAGDALLLGAHALETLGRRAALVTAHGWRLAAAELVQHRADGVLVRCGAVDPEPHVSERPRARGLWLEPVLGELAVRLEHVLRWEDGELLDLALRPSAPVELRAAGAVLGRGEFCLGAGQLCVRLLEWTEGAAP